MKNINCRNRDLRYLWSCWS